MEPEQALAAPVSDRANSLVEVLLTGGPFRTPTRARVSQAAVAQGKVKLSRDGGHEHFERSDAAHASGLAIFHWIMRTKVAE